MYRGRKSVQHRRGTASRRLSFFDVHDTRNEVAALEEQLLKATGSIKAYEDKQTKLLQSMSDLQNKYDRLLSGSIFALWEYCPSKSSDFRYIPSCDHDLLENKQEIGEYIVHSVIGSGHSSTVYCCLRNHQGLKEIESSTKNYVRNGNMLALKTLEKKNVVSLEDLFKVEREIEALSLLSPHQNIVRYYHTLHGLQRIYILMECYPSDLFDFIGKFKTKLSTNVIAHIVHEILSGLEHLFANSICHRDLKPENILIFMDKNNFSLKICDFGLCSILPDHDTMLTNFRGSPGFFAPESLLQSSYCGFKADLFSVGCIALEMLVTHRFFNDKWMNQYKALHAPVDSSTFADSITRGLKLAHAEVNRKYGPTLADKPTKNIRNSFAARGKNIGRDANSVIPKTATSTADFMELLLNFHPHLRPRVDKALKHKWVESGNKLQLLDTLHGRDEMGYVKIPRPAASLRQRGDVDDDDDDDDDDDMGVSRTRTASICELTMRQEEKMSTSAGKSLFEHGEHATSQPLVAPPSLGAANERDSSDLNEASLPAIIDRSMVVKEPVPLSLVECHNSYTSSGSLADGPHTESVDKAHVPAREIELIAPLAEATAAPPSPDCWKVSAKLALKETAPVEGVHRKPGPGGFPFSPITSGKSTPFGTPLESPTSSNVGSRASTPPIPVPDEETLGKLVLEASHSIDMTTSNNGGISDIFRKYKESEDQQVGMPRGECEEAKVETSVDGLPRVDGESLTDKMNDISSLVQEIQDRALVTAKVMADSLTVPSKEMPVQVTPQDHALKPLDVSSRKFKKKKLSPSHTEGKSRSPKVAEGTSGQKSKSLSPVETKGDTTPRDGKSAYLTTTPHHTYSPHNFHVSKVVPGRLVI